MKTSLKNKTIVITEALSETGKATALLLAQEGTNLILSSQGDTLLQELASECSALGAEATAIQADLTDRISVKRLFELALTFYGSIDVWINNAARGVMGEFERTPLEIHEQIIHTNLFGPLYSSYYVVPYFKRQGRGILINSNSTAGHIGTPLAAAFSASKFGLHGLSESLRNELINFKNIYVCDIFISFADIIPPEKVSRTMIKLIKNPRPSTHIGNTDLLSRFTHALFPKLTGRFMARMETQYLRKQKKTIVLWENFDEKIDIDGHYH